MKTYYRNNLNQAYLILESETEEVQDYQLAMLRENHVPGILDTSLRYVDGDTQYHFDISGKTSVLAIHEKSPLEYSDIKGLSEALAQAVRDLQRYMLPAEHLLLNPEYIFYEKGSYYFCFYPPDGEMLKDKFHKLTEYFVREVDYKDEEGVRLAYTLHKATMEENYTIEQILEEFERENLDYKVIDYTEKAQEPSYENIMIADKMEFWEPIRRLLDRRKKTCK